MRYSIMFFVLGVFYSCTPKECQVSTHKFVIPATLSPAKDTFLIGDTISVVSEFSNEVFDKETDKSYILDNFKFLPSLRIREVSDTTSNEAGVLNFAMIIDSSVNFNQFEFSSGAISYLGEYLYQIDKYLLTYKLIPQKTGLYYFSHFSRIVKLGDNQDFPGKCRGAGIDVYVETNRGDNNNVDFLSDSPDPHFNEWMLGKPNERFHKFGGYCFYVRE